MTRKRMKLVIYTFCQDPFYLAQRMEVIKETSDSYDVWYITKQYKRKKGWARKECFIDYNKLKHETSKMYK